ncbi:transposon Tf2-1 polyprotein isoform X1 [Cucumis melo var. makuwa]|uniref:Transposon Tf2-1 polyprotein isoform X1 n=1 Tax=Cucumis melo var. makuwa TaxID=1194695 RepID=A0A5A7TQX2_CUCMM|nr:transposon Tf2-1 polyprotein isoform X1 [Cucumis melo var. makuwa]
MEISKMPLIDLSLNSIVKNLEVMRLQSEKQQQMLLLMMESMAKDRSAVSDRTTKFAARDSVVAKGKKSEATSSKTIDSDRNIGECQNEKKSNIEDTSTNQSKFKKVKMSVFIGNDLDLWLFHADRYFQIHKLTESEKLEEYRNLFDKLIAPLSDVQESVVEDTFMNGLLPWIRAEVAFCRPKGLAEMM